MKSWTKKLTALLLTAGMSLSVAACNSPFRKPLTALPVSLPGCLTDQIQTDQPPKKQPDAQFTGAQTAFALALLQKTAAKDSGRNLLLSPYSVMQALAMTLNGAAGKTRSDMEQVLGGISAQELNAYLHQYRTGQPQGSEAQMLSANSVWYAKQETAIPVSEEFLKTVSGCYGAEAYQCVFNESAADDMNKWIDAKTAHMIPNMIGEISPDTWMYLLNACVFDAKWQQKYERDRITEREFHQADGSAKNVKMMFSDEKYFLKDTNARGFLKPYRGDRYAFAAILPDEDISVTDYVASLTPERLQELLSQRTEAEVTAGLPKFSAEYGTDLRNALTEMGMGDAFDGGAADFSAMTAGGQKGLYISGVQHQTRIEVDETGTKAAVATSVSVCSAAPPDQYKVTLDRPFLYCILDLETNLPVFIGILQSV